MNTGISRGSLDAIEQDIIAKNAQPEQDSALDMKLPGQSDDWAVGLSPIKPSLTLSEEVVHTAPGNAIEFPAIENDKDFTDALSVYRKIPDLDEDKQLFGNAIADFQTQHIFKEYEDPAIKAAMETRRKKEEALDALTRDWKENPEARKKAVEAFGEGFALNWEEATPRARANMGKNKVLEQLYSQSGDNEFDPWVRYKETHGLMGNVDVWKHYTEERGKAHQVEDAENEVRRGFDSKMTPMVGALIQGKTFMSSIDSIPDLTPEEKNWAYVNCGYGSEWYKSVVRAKEWAKETGVSFEYGSDETITNQTVSELGRKLLYLKKKDEVAHRMVVGLALTEIDQARNDGTAFISPFSRTLMMSLDSSMDFFSRFTVGEFFEGDVLRVSGMGGAIQQNFVRSGREPEPDRFGSSELSGEKAEIRAMMAEIAESPDGASWFRRTFDGLGKMSAQTAYYLGTQGVGTFASVTNDRFDELYGNGGGFASSLLRAGAAGGTEVLTERLGGEFFGRNLRWLSKKMPGVQKFSGYIGGATDMLKAGMYKQAGLRYGAHALGSGASEWVEELIQPTLQAPLDSSIAHMFGEKDGMSIQDWKDQLSQACSPDLIFQMMVFGAVCGVIQTPAMAREAKIARTSAGQIQTMTRCNEDRAKEIAKIVDPVEKRQAIIEEGFSNALSEAEQLGNMMNGINSMKKDFSWLSQQAAYQAEVDQLNLPRVEDLGDGKYRFTTSVKDEEGNIAKDVLELDEAAATARMNALLDDGIRSRMTEAANAFAVNEAVEAFAKSGKYVFEEMGSFETIASTKKLASAARLRIDEGADVSAPASDLGTQMSYGQAAKLDTDFGNRAKLGVERGEIASVDDARSNAYRASMKNGQTLIRFHKGEVTVSELLEEVLETHLVEDMGNTQHEVGWYVDNLRALQKALTEEGYLPQGKTLIKEDGEATMKDVIEAMSMLAKGDVMARATEMRIPVWLKDFVQMVRQWVSSAKALLDLGTGLHEMERRRLAGEAVPISEDFAETVYALSNNLESYWMQEGTKQGEIAVKEIEDEVGGGMSASLSVDGDEIDLRRCKAVDQNGRVLNKDTLITTPNGELDWFRFPTDEKTRAILKKKGIDDLPIRLKIGRHKDAHNGFGWLHILNHHDDIAERGVTPLQFLYDTVTNMTGMYDQAKSRKTFKSEKSFAEGSLLHVDLIESEGCYSMVTCYPVEGKRRPSGNELLIGRALFRFSPNSVANPFRAAHSPSKTVMRGVDATGKALEATKTEESASVNIYDVRIVDQDGRDVYKQGSISGISFSLAAPELAVSRGTQSMEIVRRISDELRADVATWGRYDGKTDEAAFLVNIGKNIAMVKSALMHLPAGRRVRVKPFIDRLQILAELAATGRIDETAAVNAFARRELGREMREAIEEEIIQLKQEATLDIEAANKERLAEKKGELNEKTEALYKSLDYLDRTAVKKAYNERNKRIISIRKRYKDEDYIARRIEKENAKLDQGMAKYQTREEKLTAQITKLETRINTLKVSNVSDKQVNDASREAITEARKAWAEKRLNQLMSEVMTTASIKLDEVAKEGIVAGINKMLDSVLTIKVKKGSQKRGKMSVEAYNYLKRQVKPMLEMKASEKNQSINEAEAELTAIEKENPDQIDAGVSARVEELNEELTMLVLYGDLKGMSVDEAEAVAKSIESFIKHEKEAWAAAMEHDSERLNAAGRKIVDEFNRTGKKASENALRAANKAYHGNVSIVKIGDFMENMDQLFKRMAAVPALKDFAESMRGRLSNAFQQMRDSRAMRAAAVQNIYETNLTGKVLKKRGVGSVAGWIEWFKTSHDTGVFLYGWVTHEVKLTLAEARELREMNAKERRGYIQARWEGGKKHVSDEVIDVLLGRLEEYEASANKAEQEGKRPRVRKYVTANISVKSEDAENKELSRDNALQAILLSEQEEYREQMKGQGYTPEVLSALREYVGEEGIAIGYALRDLLKLQGEKIGKLYEMVTGVPFPRVQNYYPARFWALDAMSDADAADMISGVPTSKGTAKGWQKVRTKHNRKLDTSVGALSVFFEASDITDHWYYTQDIITDLRGMMKRREVAESLVANIGKDDFVRLLRWIDLLERAGVVQGQAVGALDKTLNAIYSGQAKAILAFRVETMLKQGSAVLNAWIGDSSIGLVDYFTTMAKLRNGTARMGIIKMMKSAEFQARLSGKLDVEKLSRLRDDQSYTFAESLLALGMNGIEAVDVFSNAVGSAALWNIKFRQALKAGMTEENAESEAWQSVRDSLHSAQPQTWIDKSFGGLNRGAWGRAIFYMMSENFSKTAIIYGQMRMAFTPGLTKKERWKHLSHGAKVWLSYGAANALIGMMLDYFKDDEDEWEERDIQGYLFAALAGPISGMPLIGEGLEWMLSELFGARVYAGSAGKALIDFGGGYRAGKKLLKMMEEGDAEASDYMKQIVKLGRVFGAVGGIASATASKGAQVAGQYMTLGAALMNPVKTAVDAKDSAAVNKD